MNKLIATVTTAGVVLVMSVSGASAGGPTCEDMFGTGWKNHGEHVLTYVNDGGAGGGQPAHLTSAPAPGASFCLDQPQNPGLHF
jgi:hypothetical protein